MLTFPYVAPADGPAEGAEIATLFPTEIVTSRTGVEQRRGLSVLPIHGLRLRWSGGDGTATRLDTLWDFYRQTRGALLPFVLFDFDDARTWTRAYVGLGTGAKTVFNLPSRNATSVTVYVAGTATSGTFAATAGANGRDRFTFGTAPAAGAIVEVTFKGQRAFEGRHAQGALTYSVFSAILYDVGLEITEVRGES